MDFLGGGGHGEHTQKTPSYDTKMLLKVDFDKTAFANLRLVTTFKKNIDETHSKQPKIDREIHASNGF
jgi:hypothetical protein